jgi:hypothetical protein
MKSALALAVVLVLFAAPALAGDGNVSQGTLSSLGLGDMQTVSDAEGMQVRGMSSSAWATGSSVFSAFLFDPFSGANFSFSVADTGRATDENAGLNNTSSATVNTAAVSAAPVAITITTGSDSWTANVGVFSLTGMVTASSP